MSPPTEFTPGAALLGGSLIGLATALLLLASGRIAGISGILGSALVSKGSERAWRLAFLAGLPLGALGVGALRGGLEIAPPASSFAIVAAGLLVGFGTQLGSGCTSGHGICGMARGSSRSIVATGVFMAAGALTVFVVRHVLGG
jgi:hypothetical protein